jgi:hypothetical protein
MCDDKLVTASANSVVLRKLFGKKTLQKEVVEG